MKLGARLLLPPLVASVVALVSAGAYVAIDNQAIASAREASTAAVATVAQAVLIRISAGLPAALGFADVRNHLNTPKLSAMMGTDLFVYHGYVQFWLGERSFKATPAFNMALCERFGVKPLIFDGSGDVLFHEYDTANRRHMEYVNDRGLFVDFPARDFMACFRATYPRLAELKSDGATGAQDPGFAPD